MAYRIETRPPWSHGYGSDERPEVVIVQVGCGGTGSLLAEALCRLLIGVRGALYLVDMDRVEEHNLRRQSFDAGEVGRFKSEVLAERLARRFERTVGYSVLPYDGRLHAAVFRPLPSRLALVVGCVDTAAGRRAIAATLDQPPGWGGGWSHAPAVSPVYWLDAGNGRHAGQVLLGNVTRPHGLRGAFLAAEGRCTALPAPSLQRPDLLSAPEAAALAPTPAPTPDCAEAVAAGEQSDTINAVMAALTAGIVEQLLDGDCTTMATYIDIADGMLRRVPADPATAAALVGLPRSQVITPVGAEPRAMCNP